MDYYSVLQNLCVVGVVWVGVGFFVGGGGGDYTRSKFYIFLLVCKIGHEKYYNLTI